MNDMRRARMPDEELPSPPECFICTESVPPPRKSACKCTDRYVHDACLVKMLETSKHTQCPVCATPYANVVIRTRVVGVDIFSRGGAVLFAAMAAATVLWCAKETWWVYEHRKLSGREDFFVCFAAILMFSGGCAVFAYIGRECVATGPRALLRSMLVRKRVVGVTGDLPAEVALPPRLDAEELELVELSTR